MLFLTFCINHTLISPTAKKIRAHVCSATNRRDFPRKLKIAPKALPTVAGNASRVFPASLLSASANLPNYFFKIPSSFGEEPLAPLPPPPKTPVMARAIVEIVIERAVNIKNMVLPCSRKRTRIVSANYVF